MSESRKTIGQRGEDLACTYLEGEGQKVLTRNWRWAHLEVDIVSLSGKVLHFVEVKTRVAPVMAEPELNVGATKQRRLIAAAQAFVRSKFRALLPSDLEVYFDVVTVVLDKEQTRIEYYQQAFIPIYA